MNKAGTRRSKRALQASPTREHRTVPKNPTLLVIGYGNQLRSDDGVGVKAAAAVQEWNLPEVRTMACHQLTPELAEPISSARCVVFVDASVAPGDSVELREIRPKAPAQIMAHAADPRSLLGLAKALFGHAPSAYWLRIPVENVAFGEELSSRAQQGLQTALKKIRALPVGDSPVRSNFSLNSPPGASKLRHERPVPPSLPHRRTAGVVDR